MTPTCKPVRSFTRATLILLVSITLAVPALASAVFAYERAPAESHQASAVTSGQHRVTHRVTHRDPAGDVLEADADANTTSPAPGDRTSDVVRTVVDHRTGRLVVKARVREVRRSGLRLLLVEILTDAGHRYWLTVDYSQEPLGKRVTLEKSSGVSVDCSGATWSVDRAADRVSGAIPRSCLKDPAWVRVGVGAVSARKVGPDSRVDDSRRDGRIDEKHLKLGPRQHHS